MAKAGKENFVGILLGLAIGDAMGATLEFGPRRPLDNLHTEMSGGGPFDLAPGEWTDDTAMAVAMASSLMNEKAFCPLCVLREWSDWYSSGKHSCTGSCFDIGHATRIALGQFLRNPEAIPAIEPSALGNGSLMRLAPVVLFASSPPEAELLAYQQSILTHGEEAARATGWFARLLFETAEAGFNLASVSASVVQRKRNEVSSSGFYKDTLEAAIWAVANTASFEGAIIQAVNLGDDADTVGAVAGQLAGAIYGTKNIPSRWLERLAWHDKLEKMACDLIEFSESMI